MGWNIPQSVKKDEKNKHETLTHKRKTRKISDEFETAWDYGTIM